MSVDKQARELCKGETTFTKLRTTQFSIGVLFYANTAQSCYFLFYLNINYEKLYVMNEYIFQCFFEFI